MYIRPPLQGESIVTKPGPYGTLLFSTKDKEKPVVFFPPRTRATVTCGSPTLREKSGFDVVQDAIMGEHGQLLFPHSRVPPTHPCELPPGLSLVVVAVPGSGA